MARLVLFLAIAGFAVLSGCGADPESATAPPPPAGGKVLHVYNWADYIGESTIRDFE